MSDSPPGPIRPSQAWELGTGALLVAIAGTAGFAVFSVTLVAATLGYLHGDDDPSALVSWIVDDPDLAVRIDLFGVLLTFAYLIGFFVWRYRTRAFLRPYGFDVKSVTKHPGVVAWTVATVLAYCTGRLANAEDLTTIDGMTDILQFSAASNVIRILGLIGLATAVLAIRRRVHMSLAAYYPPPAPVFTPPPAYTAPPPGPAGPPAPAPARDVPGIDALPFADDGFWHRVRQAGADADLALLETSGPRMHRWVLIPADTDPAAVQASLAPGSAITVFTEPPSRRETAGYQPPAATEYHGLLESAETGAIWYQSVTSRRLPGFLDRAGTGGRWALYPVGDPNALNARLS